METTEDLFKTFVANLQLFVQQTEFAKRNCNLSVYQNQMRRAIVSRHSLDTIFWFEDSHLIAFALLYDITVFVYDSVNKTMCVH